MDIEGLLPLEFLGLDPPLRIRLGVGAGARRCEEEGEDNEISSSISPAVKKLVVEGGAILGSVTRHCKRDKDFFFILLRGLDFLMIFLTLILVIIIFMVVMKPTTVAHGVFLPIT